MPVWWTRLWPSSARGRAPAELDSWLQDFLAQTDAELVVASDAEALDRGQTEVHTYIYVTPALAADAPEVAGWYDLDTSLADRSLDSPRARAALLNQVVDPLSGLQSFLTGWTTGRRATRMRPRWHSPRYWTTSTECEFDPERPRPPARGHARDSASALAEDPQEAVRLLARGARDYRAIDESSDIIERAR